MRRSDEAGFSLLETVVAFAIAAVALTSVLRIYATSSSVDDRAADRLAAVALADERIAALRVAPSLRAGTLGPVSEQGLVWRVELVGAASELSPDQKDLFLVRVAVGTVGGAPLLNVSTLLHARAASAEDGR